MNIEKLVRKNILQLKPYTAARHSHHNGILLDANENSYGTTLPGNEYESINRYPDPYQKNLREGISRLYNIPTENLFFGVGSDEIIDLVIRVFCRPGIDNVIITEPTYGMYKVACDINDVEVKNVPLTENFDINGDKIKKAADENTKIIFLCSPNNPTANLINKETVVDLIDRLDLIVVVDEAYIDFAGGDGFIHEIKNYSNLIVMRTFSKAWGLAGVRCGYCAASEKIIDILFRVKAPYNISKLTSDTICRAMGNVEQRDKYIKLILEQRERIDEALRANKKILNVLPSDANFISFKVEKPQKVFKYLEGNGIVIRDRSNQFNFGGYLRVTIGTKEENNLFLEKLNEIL
jgi:histidinol-phosphate aminotransferase